MTCPLGAWIGPLHGGPAPAVAPMIDVTTPSTHRELTC